MGAKIFVGLLIVLASAPALAAPVQDPSVGGSPQVHQPLLKQIVDPGMRNNKKHKTARVQSSAPQSRDALVISCRRQVFRKYGAKTAYGMLALRKEFVVQHVDTCVAAGGVAN